MEGFFMKHFTIGRVGLVLLATALVGLSQAAVASAAPGGNSANAKLCQKGGWQTLTRSDGSSFANQDACVSYAAQGGTLVKESQAQIDCQSFGGTYVIGGIAGINALWTCEGYNDSISSGQPNGQTLATDCFNEGGSGLATTTTFRPPFTSVCVL
jgi:hypothetical protein